MDGITATTSTSSATPTTSATTAAAATTATTASTSRTTKKLCFYIAVILGIQFHEGYAKLLVHISPFLLDPVVGVVKVLVVI
ncbi:TPA: hypothetical protein SMR42_000881 [Pseudomonas putida]|nr:hypothetical protein [Pseudomonas putida]